MQDCKKLCTIIFKVCAAKMHAVTREDKNVFVTYGSSRYFEPLIQTIPYMA